MLRSTINNLVLPHLVLPAAGLLTANQGWRYYQQFLASDREPPETRKARQWQRLRRIIEHAYQHTAYWRRHLDGAGLTPGDIRTPADFRRIPVTTKQDLRDAFPDEFLAQNVDFKSVRISNTSGTAGQPLFLAQDQDDINYKYASKLRTRHLMGARLGDRVLRLAPNECQPCLRDGSSGDVGPLELLKMWWQNHPDFGQARFIFLERKLVNPLVHQRRFPPPLPSAFEEQDVAVYLELLEQERPEILVGHPLYLYLLARLVEKRGRHIRGVRVVDCSGDLSTARLRTYLSQQFNAPVNQIYGGCEWGRIAGSCADSDGLMHLLDDLCYVEFLQPDGQPVGPGELGNIVVTSLTNTAMPLIRFEHGDLGWFTDEPCGCGRTSRRMDVEGRLQALIIRPDGQPVPASAVMELVLPHSDILLYKLIQQAPQRFTLELRLEPGASLGDQEALRHNLQQLFGDRSQVDITLVAQIPPAPSGKFRLMDSTSFEPFRCVPPERRNAPLGEHW